MTHRLSITGSRGTVGRALIAAAQKGGHTASGWDRHAAPPDDYWAMDTYVAESEPTAVVNLAIASQPTGKAQEGWLVNIHWPHELAWLCRQHEIKFLHTSTVMVFKGSTPGPYQADHAPDETDGYGNDKRRAEVLVCKQNPDAVVVRLGWQIGYRDLRHEVGANCMLTWLHDKAKNEGVIRASTKWIPACAFLDDTADALMRALELPGGVYQSEGNRAGMSFYEIVTMLNKKLGNPWKVEATDDFVQDQRMIDDRLKLRGLNE